MGAEMRRSVRARAAEGLVSYGLTVALPCPVSIELAAKAGYDFVRIDCEHSYLSPGELRELLTVARLLGMPCQVRVPDLGSITPLLGQEPAGIMVPHVECVQQVRQAVSLCRFAPVGQRGMDGGTRLIRCGGIRRKDYMAQMTADQNLILQIESRSGIERIDELLSVEGPDMVATGRADLSQSLGVAGQKNHPDVIAAENYIIQRTLAHKKIPTVAADSPARIEELYRMGVRCFLIGRDEMLLDKAIQNNLAGKRLLSKQV